MEVLDRKIKKHIELSDIDRALEFKSRRISHFGTFEWVQRANVFSYKSENKRHEFCTSDRYEGIHIVSNVKRHIRAKLKSGEIELPNYNAKIASITSFFDKNNLINNNGCEIVSIDFRRCYWTTLYRLGYISEKIYKSGLESIKTDKNGNKKNVDYKLVCNMSIGSLGVKEHFEKYVDGKLIESGVRRCDLNPIRLHVIAEVFNVAVSIINKNKETESGFLWFLTDCFFVRKDVAKMYEDAISEYGYESKTVEYEKYKVETSFSREFGYMKYFVKWGAWNTELAKTYFFNRRNEINEMIKNAMIWSK